MEEDYLISDVIGVQSTVWSPCGKSTLLNLKQEVKIQPYANKENIGMMDVATTDHKLEQILYFQWRKCEVDNA